MLGLTHPFGDQKRLWSRTVLFGALLIAPFAHSMITVTRYGVVVGESFVTYV